MLQALNTIWLSDTLACATKQAQTLGCQIPLSVPPDKLKLSLCFPYSNLNQTKDKLTNKNYLSIISFFISYLSLTKFRPDSQSGNTD